MPIEQQQESRSNIDNEQKLIIKKLKQMLLLLFILPRDKRDGR